VTAVDDRARPLDLTRRMQPRQQQRVQLLPHPARCHSSSRRQQVNPEPKPSSCGRCIHGIPVCSTNRIPDSACRSDNRFRPGFRTRRVTFGNNGSTSAHNSSLTSHGGLALIDTPLSLTTDADAIRRQPDGPFILQ
jgi:hypothetical protein